MTDDWDRRTMTHLIGAFYDPKVARVHLGASWVGFGGRSMSLGGFGWVWVGFSRFEVV